MKHLIRLCVLIVGIGCLGASAFLFLENQQLESQAQATRVSVTQSLTQTIQAQAEQPIQAQPVQETPLSTTIELEGQTYLGILSISQLALELPIASTYHESTLKTTPCVYTGSVEQGDLVIAAHNYNAHFGTINQLQPGDTATLTDASGTQHLYSVTAQEIIDGSDVDGLYAGDWDLTLFTCLYGNNTQRVVVRLTQMQEADTTL